MCGDRFLFWTWVIFPKILVLSSFLYTSWPFACIWESKYSGFCSIIHAVLAYTVIPKWRYDTDFPRHIKAPVGLAIATLIHTKQYMNWQSVFANHLYGRELILRIYKEHKLLGGKKTTQSKVSKGFSSVASRVVTLFKGIIVICWPVSF